jgi:hypothetical protein
MLIKLPFRLRVESADGKDGRVDLSKLLPEDPNEDLLGREGEDEDISEYIDMAKSLSLVIDYHNTIGLEGFTVNVIAGQGAGERTIPVDPLSFGTGIMTVTLEKGDMDYPFRPLMQILVPLESGQNYGLLEVKRGEEGSLWGFSARIKTTIQTDIDKEFSF